LPSAIIRRQPGFILLTTLIVLALAAVVLADVTRRSLRQASVALRTQEELQRRWGIASCRSALLPVVEQILQDFQTKQGDADQPLVACTMVLTLGGEDLQLVFADEQAKANLNAIYLDVGPERADQTVRKLIQHAPDGLVVRLAPDRRAAADSPSRPPGGGVDLKADTSVHVNEIGEPPPFGTWAQVFEKPQPAQLLARRAGHCSAIQNLTCWGDGRLNIRRASTQVMEARCGRVLGKNEIIRLVRSRQMAPDLELPELLDTLELTTDQRRLLESQLTDRSSCHSMWVGTIAADESVANHELVVRVTPRVCLEDSKKASASQDSSAILVYRFSF